MGSITARKKANGALSYTAQIRLRRGDAVHSEAQTFERRPAAVAWLKKREKELAAPGAIERAKSGGVTLGDAIDRYIEESSRAMGRTKRQVLAAIRASDIAAMDCEWIGSPEIVAYLQSLTGQPQTVGNYGSHLQSVFAIAKPAWGYPLDASAMKDAITVCRRMGVVGRSLQRSRRPTIAELDALLAFFEDRRQRVPQSMPMVEVILFALFSTRRQEEIVRIRWADYEPEHARVLVRDMKNPGEKRGNDVWVDVPAPAAAVIARAPRKADEIFPYTAGAISANFTRAAQLLGIEDLHFHDLRHDGVSRLFELGWSIPQVATVSGHRSWASLKRYTHMRLMGDRYESWVWFPQNANQPSNGPAQSQTAPIAIVDSFHI